MELLSPEVYTLQPLNDAPNVSITFPPAPSEYIIFETNNNYYHDIQDTSQQQQQQQRQQQQQQQQQIYYPVDPMV